MFDFTRNHFELFGLPARFRLDAAALERGYRELQRDVHPDRYAGAADHEKRLALQGSAQVNEAYRTLKDPVARAEYLLQLSGIDATAETDTRMRADFLMRQLERREGADDARAGHDESALAAILEDVQRESGELLADLESVLDGEDREAARMRVRELRFLAKIGDDLRDMQLAELDR